MLFHSSFATFLLGYIEHRSAHGLHRLTIMLGAPDMAT